MWRNERTCSFVSSFFLSSKLLPVCFDFQSIGQRFFQTEIHIGAQKNLYRLFHLGPRYPQSDFRFLPSFFFRKSTFHSTNHLRISTPIYTSILKPVAKNPVNSLVRSCQLNLLSSFSQNVIYISHGILYVDFNV